jgi:hypothetical protein
MMNVGGGVLLLALLICPFIAWRRGWKKRALYPVGFFLTGTITLIFIGSVGMLPMEGVHFFADVVIGIAGIWALILAVKQPKIGR